MRSVSLSNQAKSDLKTLFGYLDIHWPKYVSMDFVDILKRRLSNIAQNPHLFPKSKKITGIRGAVLNRQTSMYYTFDDEEIFIITFFDNRQDPTRLEHLLGSASSM